MGCIESCLPIGWRTVIWWKIHQSGGLFWFGLRNDVIIYLRAAIQRTIDASPALMEYGLTKNIAAWTHANRDLNKQEDWIQFCMKRLKTLKSFKIFKSEIKKLKTYIGWCPFKGLSNDTTLMQIQSGRSVPLNKFILPPKSSVAGERVLLCKNAAANPKVFRRVGFCTLFHILYLPYIACTGFLSYISCDLSPNYYTSQVKKHRQI
jgi:hypothetical protein